MTEVVSKIPIGVARQLWVLASRSDDRLTVELRVHHVARNGMTLPTRHGFQIPFSCISGLQRCLAELMRAAKGAAEQAKENAPASLYSLLLGLEKRMLHATPLL